MKATTGIVHFGPGAFHRAHQAHYVDHLLRHDPRWGIAGVSLRTAETVNALKTQGGRYTLAILDSETTFRTIHAHTRFLGPRDSASIRAQLLDPAVRLVTSTVTEKGYCLRGDGALDFEHPDIRHDLADPRKPRSLIGWIALGLADRRAQAIAPFTPICCDNMAHNGRKFRDAVVAFAREFDSDLADWIAGEVRFPKTMVDAITPATDNRLRRLVYEKTGFDDQAPVCREAFAQWVVEDILPAGSPALASAGVTMTGDVTGWERAKLRILNGAHSTLAYLGLLMGHETVADAIADPMLGSFVRRLVTEDIIPTLEPSPIDLKQYAKETFERFRNPAIGHRLSQIAWDGSQKLPYRLLDTISDARAAGRPLERLAVPIAAWMVFIGRQAHTGTAVVDPLAERLVEIFRNQDVIGLFNVQQIFPKTLVSDPSFRDAVTESVARMRSGGPEAVISMEAVRA